MDKLLTEFHLNTRLHEKAIEHALDKNYTRTEANVLMQPEAWDILTEQIASGNYHTKVPTVHYIDKGSGNYLTYDQAVARNMEKVREIQVMDKLDRVVWNMFYQVLYSRFAYLIHPLCKSYKRGESTRTVARELHDKITYMKSFDGTKNDLSKYFDSVPISIIDKQLDELEELEPSCIWKVIREHYHDDHVIINGEVVERYGSLKQGNPVACLLADIILRDIDEEMTKYDVVYYRYSDDFICIGREQAKAYKKIKEMLATKGIKLNDKKTEYLNENVRFDFLGFSFRGSNVTVTKKTLKHITHKIKEQTISQCRQKHRALTDAELRLAIDNIQYYLFEGCEKAKGGMCSYLFSVCNDMQDIAQIDEFAKDCIRAAKTNRCNIYGLGASAGVHGIVIHNKGKNVRMNKTKEMDAPRDLGWYSLSHMYNKYMCGKDVYQMEVLKIKNGVLADI